MFDRKAYNKKYNEENKEEILKKAKEYYYKNRKKCRAKNNAYYVRTSEKRIAQKLKTEVEKIKKGDLLKLKEKQNYLCNECTVYLDESITRFVHLDHIMPLSKGGGHILKNLQYLCQKCNLTKFNKICIQKN